MLSVWLGPFVGPLAATAAAVAAAATVATVVGTHWDTLNVMLIVLALIAHVARSQLEVWLFTMLTGRTPFGVAQATIDHLESIKALCAFALRTPYARLALWTMISGCHGHLTLPRRCPKVVSALATGLAYGLSVSVVRALQSRGWYGQDVAAVEVMVSTVSVCVGFSVMIVLYQLHLRWFGPRDPTLHVWDSARNIDVVAVDARFRVVGSDTHKAAGRQLCCVCANTKDLTLRCVNIADYVCVGCVVRWTLETSAQSSNIWPCCREN